MGDLLPSYWPFACERFCSSIGPIHCERLGLRVKSYITMPYLNHRGLSGHPVGGTPSTAGLPMTVPLCACGSNHFTDIEIRVLSQSGIPCEVQKRRYETKARGAASASREDTQPTLELLVHPSPRICRGALRLCGADRLGKSMLFVNVP